MGLAHSVLGPQRSSLGQQARSIFSHVIEGKRMCPQNCCSGCALSCGFQCHPGWSALPEAATLGKTVCLELVISWDHGKNWLSVLAVLAGKIHLRSSCVLVQLFWDQKDPINVSDLSIHTVAWGKWKKAILFRKVMFLHPLTSQAGLKKGKPGVHCTWKFFQSLLLLFLSTKGFPPPPAANSAANKFCDLVIFGSL